MTLLKRTNTPEQPPGVFVLFYGFSELLKLLYIGDKYFCAPDKDLNHVGESGSHSLVYRNIRDRLHALRAVCADDLYDLRYTIVINTYEQRNISCTQKAA